MIQKSTMQVPCGPHSIIEEMYPMKIPPFYAMVYLVINGFSNWDTGQSHGLSFRMIAERMGVYKKNKKGKWTGKSRVANAIRWLCENGWLEKNIRGGGKPNTYKVIHHNCAPEAVPLDDDGRPKKCATPRGEGSAFQKMIDGEITWEACLYHTVAKVVSDWTTGTVKFTIRKARMWLRFSRQKICEIRDTLIQNGLLEEIGQRFRGFVAKILPAPYKKRRKRRESAAVKGMRCDGKYYYSYNEKWRISRETGNFETLDSNNWRFASEYELERVNSKIHFDFMNLRELLISLQKFRTSSETA